MNGRHFKKLCKKAHALVIRVNPQASKSTCRAAGDESWWHDDIKKGTLGFGGMSGYEQPEWYDDSAYSALWEYVFWSVCDDSKCRDGGYPEWPKRMKPRRPADLLALAERLAVEAETKRDSGVKLC
jgi:hypothetical protein